MKPSRFWAVIFLHAAAVCSKSGACWSLLRWSLLVWTTAVMISSYKNMHPVSNPSITACRRRRSWHQNICSCTVWTWDLQPHLAAILFGQNLFFHTVLSLDQLTCPPPGFHSARCISCRWNCVGATSGLVFEWQVLKQSESEPWGPALLMVPTDTKDNHISSLWGRKTLPIRLRRPNYSWTLTPNINWSGKVCMTSCWMLGMSRMTQHSLRGFGIEGDIHQSASRVDGCCDCWLTEQTSADGSWRGNWPSSGLPPVWHQRKHCLRSRQQPSPVSPLSVSTVLDRIHCEFMMKNYFSEQRVNKNLYFCRFLPING